MIAVKGILSLSLPLIFEWRHQFPPGIEVYDKDHEWRSSDGQRGPIPATAAGATSVLPDYRVFALLSEREEARRKKVLAHVHFKGGQG